MEFAVFDAAFYREVLPERVIQQCHGQPGAVPVVNLHLANGSSLDLCHIVHLADAWLAVRYFRDAQSCEDMDTAFVPYSLVAWVTVSLYHPESRRMGFSVGGKPGLSEVQNAAEREPGDLITHRGSATSLSQR